MAIPVEEPCSCLGDVGTRSRSWRGFQPVHCQKGRWEASSSIESVYFNESALVFNRNVFPGSSYVLQINLDGFLNILQRFLPRIALRHASGKNGNRGDVPAVFFLLQNYGVAHELPLSRVMISFAAKFAHPTFRTTLPNCLPDSR